MDTIIDSLRQMSDEEARMYIKMLFDGYINRKKEKRLFEESVRIPQVIILTYYSCVKKPPFINIYETFKNNYINDQKNFKERYIYNENKLEDTFTFLGYQTNPYKYLSKCDLFVCTSISEGFSTAATEALIMGVPVVTTPVAGMQEMLGSNNEFGIIAEHQEQSLYECIKRLLDAREVLEDYKKKALLRGKAFSTETTVKAVENMLESLYEG